MNTQNLKNSLYNTILQIVNTEQIIQPYSTTYFFIIGGLILYQKGVSISNHPCVRIYNNNYVTKYFFISHDRLRVLNVSANQLSVLPGLPEGQGERGTIHTQQDCIGSPKVTLSLQELYAAANRLRDLSPLQHCRAMRILHAPYNRITSLHDK